MKLKAALICILLLAPRAFADSINGNWQNDQNLHQVTTWVNPQNASSCMTDPDMQPDRITDNRFAIAGEELQIYMKIGDDDFVYLLARQNDSN